MRARHIAIASGQSAFFAGTSGCAWLPFSPFSVVVGGAPLPASRREPRGSGEGCSTDYDRERRKGKPRAARGSSEEGALPGGYRDAGAAQRDRRRRSAAAL